LPPNSFLKRSARCCFLTSSDTGISAEAKYKFGLKISASAPSQLAARPCAWGSLTETCRSSSQLLRL
jgi:hypothetical protein